MAPKKQSPSEDAEDYGYDSGHRATNWFAVIAILAVLMVGFIGCTGAVGTATYFYLRPGADDAKPDKKIDNDLAESITDAGVSVAHATYFAKVCSGIANRLEVDGESKAPIFDQRKEVVDLVGIVGSLAVAGNDAANYRKLPDIIEVAFEDVWESDKDGKLKAGDLTEDDREEVIDRWNDLASAFKEVAGI